MPKVADFIAHNRERLVGRFVEEASQLESARGLTPEQVIDTLPEYLDTLVAISRRAQREDSGDTRLRLLETHIGGRLRQGFNQDDVTAEYVLLGRLVAALWEGLPSEERPTPEDVQLLFDELDSAMDLVVDTFTGYSLKDRQREKRTLRRLDVLAPTTLRRGVQLRERLEPLVSLIQEAMGADGAELLLATDGGQVLEFGAATGRCPVPLVPYAVPVDGRSFVAHVARSDEVVVLPKVSEARLEVREEVRRSGLQTLMGVRLWPQGKLLGVLYVGVTEARPFEPQAKRSFETLVEYLSGILDRALLFEDFQRTQEQLRESETRYRLASEAIADAIWDWDLSTDRLHWSMGVQKLFGYHPEELGDSISGWYDNIHPEDRERVVHGIHAVIDGKGHKWEDEYRFRHRDGGYVLVTDHGIVERDPHGKAVRMVGAMQDVSALRAAHHALEVSEDRLSLALRATRVGTWDMDPLTGSLRWDSRSKELFGVSPAAEVTFDTFLAAIHPEDRKRVQAVVQRSLDPSGSGEYDAEFRIIGLENGVERWVRATGRALFEGGRAVRFIGTVQDTSALKASQEALQRSEQAFRTLTEAMPQLVWTSRPDGQLDYFNPRLLEYLGRSIEEMRGLGWVAALHEDDVARVTEVWGHSVATGEPYQVELRLRRYDGSYRWHLARGVAMRDGQGRVRKWLGTTTDIDDLKRTEAELRRRSEFDRQLVGIVSHDLRNPINAILLSASVLLERQGLGEWQTKTVDRVRTSAQRAARLISDLLDFTQARLGGGVPLHPSPEVDLHAIAAQLADETRAAHPKRSIEVVHEGDARGEFDPDRLEQVLTNLLSNALAYSPPATPVRVETRGEGAFVVLEVRNRGAPIPPDVLPHIFEPMRRGTAESPEKTQSLGLGLFIVDQIVRAHEGTITVRSTGEEGTTFVVRLPRKRAG